ncbi:cationic amino acid transporter 8, vacuolar-like [Syzygium oleosum]|uniref:cationic amino acid transporter 8, vacuolar-like n=1 Tax=Syzygium oleosum TaxID=219896 RepID=UPI0024B8D37B|nr:cationic amino acid transporter 8, vacuolar-like [Syzygium oleosum]
MDAQKQEQRSYWRWSKQDFFPEESFVSFASYRTALSQTFPRLRDRILYRSTQSKELVELKKESENDMKRCLNWWDLMWLCFGSVVGSGIFVITGQEAHDHAGPAIVLSYAVSGLSALLSAFCYTEFAVEIPVAGASGVFAAAAIVYWSYTGFDMVATMAEETKKPSRDIPIGLAGSMTVITVIYCLMALALTMMQKYTKIDRNASYSVAFSRIGMKWAKYVVSICALKGMTTSLLVGALGQARYMTQIARAHMIPPWFALVHPKTGTPINATLLITVLSAVVAFFSSLDVLSSVLSFSTLFIFMLMAIAFLVRRYYVKGETPKSDLHKFLVYLFVIVASCIGGTAVWGTNTGGWIGYVVAVIFWFLGTLGMQLLPQRRAPQLWGIPLVPYLPSLSIGMNVFLIGSLGAEAFWRFFICTAVMILYYFLVGLHATYDVAHHIAQESKVKEGKENVDRGLS